MSNGNTRSGTNSCVVEQTIKDEDSVLLNVALEPLYIHKEEGAVDYVGDRVGSKAVVRKSDSVRQVPLVLASSQLLMHSH